MKNDKLKDQHFVTPVNLHLGGGHHRADIKHVKAKAGLIHNLGKYSQQMGRVLGKQSSIKRFSVQV